MSILADTFPCLAEVESGRCHGDCCGIVSLPSVLWERLQGLAVVDVVRIEQVSDDIVMVFTEDGYCVFLDRGDYHCVIYEDRPDVCRRFGLGGHPAMFCPHLEVDGERRTRSSRRRMERALGRKGREMLLQMKGLRDEGI